MGKTKFGIFDKVTIGTIVGAGCLQALQQALKDADAIKAAAPALRLDGPWNYVPLALIVIGAASWTIKQILIRKPEQIQYPRASKPSAEQYLIKFSAQKDGRYFIEDTHPAELSKKFTGHTDIEGSRLVQKYVGKWMKLSGNLRNITQQKDVIYLHIEEVGSIPFIHIEIGDKNIADLLEVGQKVFVSAKIEKVERHSVWFREAEIISESDRDGAVWIGGK